MKAMPISSISRSACRGVRLMLTPRASSTSALPERLEMERFRAWPPDACGGGHQGGGSGDVEVERPPPVPQVSISSAETCGRRGTQLALMALAKADSSSKLVPFMSRPTRKPAICTSLTSPWLMAENKGKDFLFGQLLTGGDLGHNLLIPISSQAAQNRSVP